MKEKLYDQNRNCKAHNYIDEKRCRFYQSRFSKEMTQKYEEIYMRTCKHLHTGVCLKSDKRKGWDFQLLGFNGETSKTYHYCVYKKCNQCKYYEEGTIIKNGCVIRECIYLKDNGSLLGKLCIRI